MGVSDCAGFISGLPIPINFGVVTLLVAAAYNLKFTCCLFVSLFLPENLPLQNLSEYKNVLLGYGEHHMVVATSMSLLVYIREE